MKQTETAKQTHRERLIRFSVAVLPLERSLDRRCPIWPSSTPLRLEEEELRGDTNVRSGSLMYCRSMVLFRGRLDLSNSDPCEPSHELWFMRLSAVRVLRRGNTWSSVRFSGVVERCLRWYTCKCLARWTLTMASSSDSSFDKSEHGKNETIERLKQNYQHQSVCSCNFCHTTFYKLYK